MGKRNLEFETLYYYQMITVFSRGDASAESLRESVLPLKICEVEK